MSSRAMHRTEGNLRLNAAGLDESRSKISEVADSNQEISDEANSSELAQVSSLIMFACGNFYRVDTDQLAPRHFGFVDVTLIKNLTFKSVLLQSNWLYRK